MQNKQHPSPFRGSGWADIVDRILLLKQNQELLSIIADQRTIAAGGIDGDGVNWHRGRVVAIHRGGFSERCCCSPKAWLASCAQTVSHSPPASWTKLRAGSDGVELKQSVICKRAL